MDCFFFKLASWVNAMIVIINGEEKNIPDNASASELVALLDLQNAKIAMEVNQEIVPRSQYAEHKLNNGDKIEIVRAIGGG